MCSSRAFYIALFLSIGLQSAMAGDRGIAIEWDPRESAEGAGAIWLGYLIARTAYRDKHKLPLPASGEIIPTLPKRLRRAQMPQRFIRNSKPKIKNCTTRIGSKWSRLSRKASCPHTCGHICVAPAGPSAKRHATSRPLNIGAGPRSRIINRKRAEDLPLRPSRFPGRASPVAKLASGQLERRGL